MDTRSAASVYREASLESAPPIKIVHLLYEGALRLIEQAEGLDPRQAGQEFTNRLNRAGAIVSELRISLDHEPAPELSDKLNALYLFVEERLHEAQLDRRVEPLPAARDVLSRLLDGWKQVDVAK